VERRNEYIAFVRKTGRKKPIGTPSRRCGDIIKMFLQEAGFEYESGACSIHCGKER
jgi:hypothetical protein